MLMAFISRDDVQYLMQCANVNNDGKVGENVLLTFCSMSSDLTNNKLPPKP